MSQVWLSERKLIICEVANLSAEHVGRITVFPEDLKLVRQVRAVFGIPLMSSLYREKKTRELYKGGNRVELERSLD